MFEEARFIQNSFSVFFPVRRTIRKMVVAFEEKLEGKYNQPQIINIPDEIEPEAPRIVFVSKHGHSQIIISQVNIVLNVMYSLDWQTNLPEIKQYLQEKVQIVFELLDLLQDNRLLFCGLTTIARLKSHSDANSITSQLIHHYSKDVSSPHPYDFNLKISRIVSDSFFSNISIENYRSWNIQLSADAIVRLSSGDVNEAGAQITGDFNDRHAFNEDSKYCSSREQATTVIEQGLNEVNAVATTVMGIDYEITK